MWTPVMEAQMPKGTHLPFGMIFATFMVAMMVGSAGT